MRNKVKTYLLPAAMVLFCNILAAQVMMPSAKSNRGEMLIGEQAEITLSLEFNKQNDWPDIQFPYLQDELTEGLEIVEVTPVDTINPNENDPGLFQLSQRYTITSFDSGYYEVKPFGILVNGDSLFSNRLRIAVHTLAVDTTQMAIYDIKEIYDLELSFADYMALYGWIVLLILFGGAGIVLLWYFLKKPKQSEKQLKAKPEPKIPPHIIALEALAVIEKAKPWLKGDLKKYHSDLTDILRDYLENRFHFPAHEQTSNEILQQMRFTELENDTMLRLHHVLKLADMVKFAKDRPGELENKQAIDFAIEFVEITKTDEVFNLPPKKITPENFNFEYVKQRTIWLVIFGIIFLVFTLLIISVSFFEDQITIPIIISLSIPATLFFLFKNHFKSYGSFTLSSDQFELHKDGKTKRIKFGEIATYQIQYYNGVMFKVTLKNGDSTKILANGFYCNSKLLENFTDAFVSRIADISETQKEKRPIQKKSFYETKLGVVYLATITIAGIIVALYAIWKGFNIPGVLFVSFFAIFSLWAAYFKSKAKKKRRM